MPHDQGDQRPVVDTTAAMLTAGEALVIDLAHIPQGVFWFAGVAWAATIGLIVWGVRKIITMLTAGDLVTRREHDRVTNALTASEAARSTAMGQVNELTDALGRAVDAQAQTAENVDLSLAILRSLRDAAEHAQDDA